MVSHRDQELFREDIRNRRRLSATERESLLRPYLPDPADLPQRKNRKVSTSRKAPVRTFFKSQIHQLTYTIIHIFFGIAVRLIQTYHAVVDRIFAIVYYHHRTPELIRKDVKGLKRLPEHLSVILSLRKEDDALAELMDEVAELAAWSTASGIPTLSVYEKTGTLILNPVNSGRQLMAQESSNPASPHSTNSSPANFPPTTALPPNNQNSSSSPPTTLSTKPKPQQAQTQTNPIANL